MSKEKVTKICPVELAGGLDNSLRRLLQNPQKILKPYIKKGMVVLDLGCGPGFFSIEIAKLLMGSGEVIAADLQEGMLDRVSKKIKGTALE
jgi:ubiquinone/menaquinone biosynthesis C-methylase UbiE